MSVVLQPKTTVNIVGANVAVENTDQKVLFVGQKTSAGTVDGGSLVENILENTEDSLFGANSMLAGMIRSARIQNPVTRFDAICFDDGDVEGGSNAAGSVAFSGTASAAGSVTVIVGSETNYSYEVAIEIGDTATEVGDVLEALILADGDVPVTAANTTGTVALTADNIGTLGNFIGLAYEGTVAGITTTLTAFTGGADDPTLTDVFDVIGDNRYQGIVWPYFASTSVLTSFLDARFNVDNKVLDGVGITSSVDSLADHLTRLNLLNSQSLVDICDKEIDETTFKGSAQMELPQIKASQFAAIRALRLTDGANIGQFVLASSGPLDAFGGPALASKPYFNTPFPSLPLVATGRGWTDVEIEQLDTAGGTVIGNNVANNSSIMGEVVTTYKTDSAGNPDISFKFLNYVDTASNVREYFYNNLRTRFAQSRLTEGDVIKGRDQANAVTIEAYCDKLYQDLSGPDFVLLEAGEEALVFFKNNRTVTINKSLGRATILMVVPLVTQLREIIATMKIAFSTQA